MLEPLSDAPAGACVLRANGTVIASDVAEAFAKAQAAPGRDGTAGFVIAIDPDFDGYLAELARGLTAAAAAPRPPFTRFALVAPDGMVSEARRLGGAGAVKIFPASEKTAAFSYAAGLQP